MGVVPTFLTAATAALLLIGSAPVPSGDVARAAEERVLRKEIVVEAPLQAVWDAWTTEEGTAFISARSRIELRVGGPYEWFLDGPVESDGRRGAEGSRVLAFLPGEMLAFEWTFPPSIAGLRKADARTQVVVMLTSLGDRSTRVRLSVLGWESGREWDEGYRYFDEAWGIVLRMLEQELEARGR